MDNMKLTKEDYQKDLELLWLEENALLLDYNMIVYKLKTNKNKQERLKSSILTLRQIEIETSRERG